MRATLSYYDLTKTNVAAGAPDLSHDCGSGSGSSLAIGAVRSRGPELDIQGEILPGWKAVATYANTDRSGIPQERFEEQLSLEIANFYARQARNSQHHIACFLDALLERI